MTEKQIIDLFWNRNEDAIAATDGAYGRKLRGLSGRILRNPEDSEEVVNDTYLKTWNSIPKARPQYFYAYIAAICLVTAREAESKDVQRVELPFTLTEAPADAEGESVYHPLNPSAIPGMTVGDLHVTKTPLGRLNSGKSLESDVRRIRKGPVPKRSFRGRRLQPLLRGRFETGPFCFEKIIPLRRSRKRHPQQG